MCTYDNNYDNWQPQNYMAVEENANPSKPVPLHYSNHAHNPPPRGHFTRVQQKYRRPLNASFSGFSRPYTCPLVQSNSVPIPKRSGSSSKTITKQYQLTSRTAGERWSQDIDDLLENPRTRKITKAMLSSSDRIPVITVRTTKIETYTPYPQTSFLQSPNASTDKIKNTSPQEGSNEAYSFPAYEDEPLPEAQKGLRQVFQREVSKTESPYEIQEDNSLSKISTIRKNTSKQFHQNNIIPSQLETENLLPSKIRSKAESLPQTYRGELFPKQINNPNYSSKSFSQRKGSEHADYSMIHTTKACQNTASCQFDKFRQFSQHKYNETNCPFEIYKYDSLPKVANTISKKSQCCTQTDDNRTSDQNKNMIKNPQNIQRQKNNCKTPTKFKKYENPIEFFSPQYIPEWPDEGKSGNSTEICSSTETMGSVFDLFEYSYLSKTKVPQHDLQASPLDTRNDSEKYKVCKDSSSQKEECVKFQIHKDKTVNLQNNKFESYHTPEGIYRHVYNCSKLNCQHKCEKKAGIYKCPRCGGMAFQKTFDEPCVC